MAYQWYSFSSNSKVKISLKENLIYDIALCISLFISYLKPGDTFGKMSVNTSICITIKIHYSKKLKEHFDIMIFIERYSLKRCQGCVKLIASKVNCFLNITDLSEVQLCMSSNSWT